jgi:hypothetical protein
VPKEGIDDCTLQAVWQTVEYVEDSPGDRICCFDSALKHAASKKQGWIFFFRIKHVKWDKPLPEVYSEIAVHSDAGKDGCGPGVLVQRSPSHGPACRKVGDSRK